MEEFAAIIVAVFMLIFLILGLIMFFCLLRLFMVLPDYLRRVVEAIEKMANKK